MFFREDSHSTCCTRGARFYGFGLAGAAVQPCSQRVPGPVPARARGGGARLRSRGARAEPGAVLVVQNTVRNDVPKPEKVMYLS